MTARPSDIAKACNEMVNQCCLADARLARNPDHRTLAVARTLPSAVKSPKRFCPTDKPLRLQVASSRLLGGRGTRYRGSNEPIALARHRFNEARLSRIVVKHRSKIADRSLQHRVADELVTPYLVEQCVLREQRALLPHERAQHRKWCWRKSNRFAIPQQACIRFIEFECVEAHPYWVWAGRGTGGGITSCHYDDGKKRLRRLMMESIYKGRKPPSCISMVEHRCSLRARVTATICLTDGRNAGSMTTFSFAGAREEASELTFAGGLRERIEPAQYCVPLPAWEAWRRRVNDHQEQHGSHTATHAGDARGAGRRQA